jgi:hypothetical protein
MSLFVSLLCLLLLPASLFAKSSSNEPVAHLSASGTAAQWSASVDHDRIALTIVAPNGAVYQKEFAAGSAPSFRLQDLGGRLTDGPYTYELRVIPRISDEVKQQLAAARAADDDEAIARIQKAAGIGAEVVQSGNLLVVNGSFVSSDAQEPGGNAAPASGTTSAASISAPKIKPLDVVTADDAIIQGSLCVGLDCVNNESFGFDTIRLKENNTRIKFDDTSTSTGFANNDWQLTANDSASGGANKFSIEDITGSKVPFTITAGAPTNSLFVASSGKVGFGNASPVLNLHITATDTPAIRQEQTSGGGFTAQTWDIGANEANWFVRDVTGGSRLPLRIRPGAPTSSIDISASGNVGVGTASPNARLNVFDSTQLASRMTLSGQEFLAASNTDSNGLAILLGVNRSGDRQIWFADSANLTQNTTNKVIRMAPDVPDISARNTDGSVTALTLQSGGGNIGIGVTNATSPIQHSNGATLSAGGVWTNASSRALKLDICDLDTAEAMAVLKEIQPVTYAYKVDPSEHHVGFIAEDVPALVATKDRKGLSPMDVVAVLTSVVKEQQKTIDELKIRLEQVEKKQ